MNNIINNKKIGIWGFGVTGQSILRYLHRLQIPCAITILEQKELSTDLVSLITQQNAQLFSGTDPVPFIEQQDIIIPSPGVNLEHYHAYKNKFIAEVDLYQTACQQQSTIPKTIAITGSVGKTSITHLLGQLLSSATVGGNIGTGMLDMLARPSDLHIIELSSFQLEQSKQFAPDLAIITNLYPNHLDRHKTVDNYFHAKYNLLAHQTTEQIALMPLSLFERVHAAPKTQSIKYFFCMHEVPNNSPLGDKDMLFCIQDGTIVWQKNGQTKKLIALDQLPDISLQENWLIICSVLYLLNIPLISLQKCRHNLKLLKDRLEKVATINQIDFYNDSKSTTNQSTIAAINALQCKSNKPIHLFLGGLSKGVDRTPLIQEIKNKCLKNQITHVYCFGKEATTLSKLCADFAIKNSAYATLEDAFTASVHNVQPGDQVLLSPGGASYDLFKNYEERGEIFRQLVLTKFPAT